MAGVLLGLCVWTKPVYALLALPFGGWLLGTALKGGWPEDRRFLAGLVGVIIPALFMIIWLAETGTLAALLEAMVNFNLSAHAAAGIDYGYWPPANLLIFPLPSWRDPLVWPAVTIALLAAVGLCRTGWQGAALLLVGWLSLATQRHFYAYHYLPFFGALALVAGEGMALLLAAQRWRLFLLTFVIILQTPFVLLIAKNALPFWQGQQVVAAVAEPEGFSYLLTRQAADKVAELTVPEDKVYLWGYDALIFFLSHRQSARTVGRWSGGRKGRKREGRKEKSGS